jgi:folate-binding protein YgfZ
MIDDRSADPSMLASGQAFADLSFWRKVAVVGSEARAWLDSLISADISHLVSGHARQSLLLSPTGRIRAAFTVAIVDETLLLIQDPQQPKPVGELLDLYVLSADVALEDRTGALSLFAFPGREAPAELVRASPSAPSCLGAGVDLFASTSDHESMLISLQKDFVHAGAEAVETWRVSAGLPRFGVDVFEDDLPQEAGLIDAVSFQKGCYLGQEAVAKVQNLGHPRRVMLHLSAAGPVSPGDPVLAEGAELGEVTSVAPAEHDESFILARVKWEGRNGPLTTPRGTELRTPTT